MKSEEGIFDTPDDFDSLGLLPLDSLHEFFPAISPGAFAMA